MKDKNLNILSLRISNPLLYIIYNWHSSPIVLIWTVKIRNILCVNIIFYFWNVMSQNLGSLLLPPPCDTMSHFVHPLNVWRSFWMAPNYVEINCNCPFWIFLTCARRHTTTGRASPGAVLLLSKSERSGTCSADKYKRHNPKAQAGTVSRFVDKTTKKAPHKFSSKET